MRKGKVGIVLAYYAVIAFVLVVLQQPVLIALLAAIAIFFEKDEWLSRQTVQALLLSIVVGCFSTLESVFGNLYIWVLGDVLAGIFGFISWLVYIAAIVFSIIAITRVYKENEANVPFLSELSYKIFGQIKPRPVPPVPPQGYQPPQAPQGYAVPPQGYQPQPPQYAPVAPPPAAPVQPELTLDPPPAPPVTPPAENSDNQ